MFFPKNTTLPLLVALSLLLSACGGNSMPASQPGATGASAANALSPIGEVSPADTTSILKKLTKTIVIGSTVDPKNGDTGPHSISIVQSTSGLKKGQLVVCNFADSSGNAGAGTTIEVLDPAAGSSPSRFAQNSNIKGCSGSAISNANSVFGAGLTSGVVAQLSGGGKLKKTYRSPIAAPFSDVDASNSSLYAAEYIFVADAQTGSIINFAINNYGSPKPKQVATGFAVNKATDWTTLGPSGLAYWPKTDKLYIVDGANNTVVFFSHASNLLVKNEIVVQPGGKTFKCLDRKATCGTLVKSGSPLNAPVAATLLPNGNLIVANTKGGNKLIEMTPTGQILATKVVDKSTTAGVFGLAASGTNDNNTVLYFTDKNTNDLKELEQ
jgi:hypothetical protein